MDLLILVATLPFFSVYLVQGQIDIVQGCGSAPDVSVGVGWRRHVTNHSRADSIIYHCQNASLTLIGPRILTCTANDTWDDKPPICKYVECPLPNSPLNGNIEVLGEGRFPGTFTNYSCHHGYVLIGDVQLTCSTTGQWTGKMPRCLIDCGVVAELDNGTATFTCTYEGCTVDYTCHKHFSIVGHNNRTCLETGKWSSPMPKCQMVFCGKPPNVTNSTMQINQPAVNGKYRVGTHVQYQCNTGLGVQGNAVSVCTPPGRWVGLIPQCAGTRNMSGSTIPTTKQLVTTPPSSTATSVRNIPTFHYTKHSTTSQPPFMCPQPQNIKFGSFAKTGNMINYTCDYGYQLQGPSWRICQRNGSWSRSLPSCIPVGQSSKWLQVFVNNLKWNGTYTYHKTRYPFKFVFLSLTQDNNTMTACFQEEQDGKFDLKGSQNAAGLIVFEMSNVLQPSKRFPLQGWAVEGKLSKEKNRWLYRGTIRNQGFDNLIMQPAADDGTIKPRPSIGPHTRHQPNPNSGAIAACVTIAALVTLTLAAAGAYYFKRRGMLRSSGHHTLTSFENPVYEYENSLK